MPRHASPRLSLADLMILIFATGFGLGCYILIDDGLFRGKHYLFGLFQPPPSVWTSRTVLDRAAGVVGSMLPMFGGWTFALPIVGIRKPGHAWRRRARGPGLTACFGVLTGMAVAAAVAGLWFGLRWSIDGSITPPANFWLRGIIFDSLIIFAGVSVTAVWVAQLVTGRWRPTRDVIDRLGRLLGVLWLASGLVFAARQLSQ